MFNNEPMFKKDHKARESKVEKFVTHTGPGGRIEIACWAPWGGQTPGIKKGAGPGAYAFTTVRSVRVSRMLRGSGLGQIDQFKPKRTKCGLW